MSLLQEKLTTGSTDMFSISNYLCVHIFSMHSSHWCLLRSKRQYCEAGGHWSCPWKWTSYNKFKIITLEDLSHKLPAVSLKSSAISCRSRRSKGVRSPPSKTHRRQFEAQSWRALVRICMTCMHMQARQVAPHRRHYESNTALMKTSLCKWERTSVSRSKTTTLFQSYQLQAAKKSAPCTPAFFESSPTT